MTDAVYELELISLIVDEFLRERFIYITDGLFAVLEVLLQQKENQLIK